MNVPWVFSHLKMLAYLQIGMYLPDIMHLKLSFQLKKSYRNNHPHISTMLYTHSKLFL